MPRKGTWIPVNVKDSKEFCEFLNTLEEKMLKINKLDIELTNGRRVEGVIRLEGDHNYILGKWVGIGKEPKKEDETL